MKAVHEMFSCSLCARPFVRGHLTRHHCRPKQKGGTQEDVALLCSQCHGMVHATYTNATLARMYPTIEELQQAPELGPFLEVGPQAAAGTPEKESAEKTEGVRWSRFIDGMNARHCASAQRKQGEPTRFRSWARCLSDIVRD